MKTMEWSHMTEQLDHTGRPVPDGETPDKTILIWAIYPGDPDQDEYWVRGYQEAVTHAQNLLSDRVDSSSEEDLLESGITITMKLRRTTLAEYNEVVEQETI